MLAPSPLLKKIRLFKSKLQEELAQAEKRCGVLSKERIALKRILEVKMQPMIANLEASLSHCLTQVTPQI